MALIGHRVDGAMGVSKKDLLGTGLGGLVDPLQVAADLIEHFLIRVRHMGDESVDACFDDRIVEMMAHRVRSRAMFMRDTAQIEQFVKVRFVGYPCIDDIAMKEDGAV